MSSLDRILPFLRPIEDLLQDPAVTEVMVNCGGRRVFVEREGALALVPDRTLESRNLTVAIKNIARACGDEISDVQPALDARLEDGSRVAAMFPPCSVDGPTLTVRKFTHRYTLDELVAVGTLTADLARDLAQAVRERRTILISGGTGTGKTTLLNALAATIPASDRIVLIEETSEILIDKPNLVRFEARRPQAALGNEDPLRAVTIADLLRATLRHRPDRILVGEVRGAEAFDLLQALNTGHQGTLSTIHANSAEQALARLAHCVLTANVGLPHRSTREAIALAIHLVVHIDRGEGRRVVREVLAVEGYDHASDRYALVPFTSGLSIDKDAPVRFLRTAFHPDDWVAVFLKSHDTGGTAQRVGPLSLICHPKFQAWLRAQNARRFSVYVSINAIRPQRRARTREAIGEIRHVFLDADKDGDAVLRAIGARRDLPLPSYVIRSSPGRLHVLWQVTGFTKEGAEETAEATRR